MNSPSLDFALTNLMGDIQKQRSAYMADLARQDYQAQRGMGREDTLQNRGLQRQDYTDSQNRRYGLRTTRGSGQTRSWIPRRTAATRSPTTRRSGTT
jgi:hypothetical protein